MPDRAGWQSVRLLHCQASRARPSASTLEAVSSTTPRPVRLVGSRHYPFRLCPLPLKEKRLLPSATMRRGIGSSGPDTQRSGVQ